VSHLAQLGYTVPFMFNVLKNDIIATLYVIAHRRW